MYARMHTLPTDRHELLISANYHVPETSTAHLTHSSTQLILLCVYSLCKLTLVRRENARLNAPTRTNQRTLPESDAGVSDITQLATIRDLSSHPFCAPCRLP